MKLPPDYAASPTSQLGKPPSVRQPQSPARAPTALLPLAPSSPFHLRAVSGFPAHPTRQPQGSPCHSLAMPPAPCLRARAPAFFYNPNSAPSFCLLPRPSRPSSRPALRCSRECTLCWLSCLTAVPWCTCSIGVCRHERLTAASRTHPGSLAARVSPGTGTPTLSSCLKLGE